MTDLQPYIKDIRWLFVQCKQAGIEPPKGEHCEAFAERVAIIIADGEMTEAEARAFAFMRHLEQRQRLAEMEKLEEFELNALADSRLADGKAPVKVSLDEL